MILRKLTYKPHTLISHWALQMLSSSDTSYVEVVTRFNKIALFLTFMHQHTVTGRSDLFCSAVLATNQG